MNAVHLPSFHSPSPSIIMIPRHEEVEFPRILCFQGRDPSENQVRCPACELGYQEIFDAVISRKLGIYESLMASWPCSSACGGLPIRAIQASTSQSQVLFDR